NKQTGVIRHKNKYDADDPFCEFVDVIEYSAYVDVVDKLFQGSQIVLEQQSKLTEAMELVDELIRDLEEINTTKKHPLQAIDVTFLYLKQLARAALTRAKQKRSQL